MAGILRVVSTPIGNLDDLSPRAARALSEADIIACEDTRVTKRLLTRAPTRARLVPLHAHNEERRSPEIVRAIAGGAAVALVSDAGTPSMSDPGRRLVAACIEAGLAVEAVPGPSAALAALVVSGIPTARFVFDGFLPRTGRARRRRLEALAGEERTIIVFESPHRIVETLADLCAIFGDRRAALSRELTKVHEETVRGTLPELLAAAKATPVRGEVTLVIEGASAGDEPVDEQAVADRVATLMEEGMSRKDAAASVAGEAGLSKRDVYEISLGGDET